MTTRLIQPDYQPEDFKAHPICPSCRHTGPVRDGKCRYVIDNQGGECGCPCYVHSETPVYHQLLDELEAEKEEALRLVKAISSARDELAIELDTKNALLQIANQEIQRLNRELCERERENESMYQPLRRD